jgi:signal transduction histidine kinase
METPPVTRYNPGPIEALDAFVEVLADAESGITTDGFYGRLCEVICRLAGMDRGVIFRYDEGVRRVRAAGAHGIDVGIFEDIHATVESAPIARRALETDTVVEASTPFTGELPDEYVALLPGGRLVCIPLAAAGRWVGVAMCHRGDSEPLSETDQHTLWILGKTAALASVARIATFEGERARELQQRIDMARDVHDGVVQRLFGVSMALDSEGDFPSDARTRAASEIQGALVDLKNVVQRPLSRAPRPASGTLADEVRRLSQRHADLSIETDPDSTYEAPAHLEPLAQSVLAEALRNAYKHAAPTHVTVRAGIEEGAFMLEVTNDGVGGRRRRLRSTGMGLRLVAFEALSAGGILEFGPREPGSWQVRLVVPVDVDG